MQAKIRCAPARLLLFAVALLLGLTTGCGCGAKPAEPTAVKKESAGGVVKLWCGDERMAGVFVPRAKAWAHRNTAKLEVVSAEADADVLLLPPAQLGRLDPPANLLTVPPALAGESSDFQWGGLIRVYQSRLAHWGGERYAVPLVGEAYVTVYRADVLGAPAFTDAFRQKYNHPPLPVRTWDELAELGQFATDRTGKPALPPLPADPFAAVAAFGHIAACYDRLATTGGGRAEADLRDPYFRGLSFYTDGEVLRNRPAEWEVRIGEPAFGEAFRWFEKTAKCRPSKPGDPTDALVSGSAVAAVVPIGDLNRLPRDPNTGAVDAKFGVAPVPGSDGYFDASGKRVKTTGANRVPHYPGGGLIGVVRQSAAHPDAAWGLLGELGGPIASSATLDTPAAGGGPLRIEQVTESTRQWQQYGFDKAHTADLSKAVHDYVAPGTINPAVGLRTPDVAAVHALLARQLAKVASGEVTADAGQQQAAKEWRELDAKTPADRRQADRRKSAGLD